jgi:hypothetical protein
MHINMMLPGGDRAASGLGLYPGKQPLVERDAHRDLG